MRLFAPEERWIVHAMADSRDDAARTDDDRVLEAAYLAEFGAEAGTSAPDARRVVAGVSRRVGDLRALAIHDLSTRVTEHTLLRRADDTARTTALRFVERRLAEGGKVAAYSEEGTFQGFLRRVLSNLLLDWLRSPAGKAELRRAEHDGSDFGAEGDTDEPVLPSEEREERRRLALHQLVAVRALQSLPPGRGVPLRLALWPAYEHEPADVAVIGGFAHCHETASAQADARACDAGKRCTTPTEAWRDAHHRELDQTKQTEPDGLSRKSIAVLTRIGHDKPMAKREGAICERISKGRLMLVEELRRAGIRGSGVDP